MILLKFIDLIKLDLDSLIRPNSKDKKHEWIRVFWICEKMSELKPKPLKQWVGLRVKHINLLFRKKKNVNYKLHPLTWTCFQFNLLSSFFFFFFSSFRSFNFNLSSTKSFCLFLSSLTFSFSIFHFSKRYRFGGLCSAD